MGQTIRWGILGAAGIAKKFAESVLATEGSSTVSALASHTPGKALAFSKENSIPCGEDSTDDILTRSNGSTQ